MPWTPPFLFEVVMDLPWLTWAKLWVTGRLFEYKAGKADELVFRLCSVDSSVLRDVTTYLECLESDEGRSSSGLRRFQARL